MKNFLLATIAAFLPLQAQAADRVSILLGSYHESAYEFNEFNPGVFLTWEREVFDYSVGVYHNSYDRTSVAGTISYSLAEWDQGQFDVFGGVAYYPQDGRTFNPLGDSDFVPIGGLQVRHNNLFAQIMPGDQETVDYVVSFGLSFELK